MFRSRCRLSQDRADLGVHSKAVGRAGGRDTAARAVVRAMAAQAAAKAPVVRVMAAQAAARPLAVRRVGRVMVVLAALRDTVVRAVVPSMVARVVAKVGAPRAAAATIGAGDAPARTAIAAQAAAIMATPVTAVDPAPTAPRKAIASGNRT